MTEGLAWPPAKEDLERLYLKEHLSAMKIAEAYGLRYANPKTAESTVLHHLKKNGIKRRDAAEHIRKVTEEMVDGWVKRYEAGESLKQIAGKDVDPVTVWNHLQKRGVVLRDKVEAQIKAVTKYEKRSFEGDDVERAYLLGFRYGDLDVVRHGRAIRVRTSTTHPAMAELFEMLFLHYGHVAKYPRESKLAGYEWSLESDLDASFSFLLDKMSVGVLEGFTSADFWSFFGGFVDAEGSIYLHHKSGGFMPEIKIVNTDNSVLESVGRRLLAEGITSKLEQKIQSPQRLGYYSPGHIWSLSIWRLESVKRTLEALRCRHGEKKSKLILAGRFTFPCGNQANRAVEAEWERLARKIEAEKLVFLEGARSAISGRP